MSDERQTIPARISDQIRAAFDHLEIRAERGERKFLSTYVDDGMLSRIAGRRNQIVMGRRGTGKTHLLGCLCESVNGSQSNDVAVYMDCRELGASDPKDGLSLDQSALILYQEMLALLVSSLLTEYEKNQRKPSFSSIFGSKRGRMRALITELVGYLSQGRVNYGLDQIRLKQHQLKRTDTKSGIDLSVLADLATEVRLGAKLQAGVGAAKESTRSEETESDVVKPPRIFYHDISSRLRELLGLLGVRHVYVILDEFSELHSQLLVQPVFLQMLKSTFFPTPAFTIKIGAIPARCKFSATLPNGTVGVTPGDDVFLDVDLDGAGVADRRNEAFYWGLIQKHVLDHCPEAARLPLQEQRRLIFNNRNVRREAMIASEGIPRDYLRILASAYGALSPGDQVRGLLVSDIRVAAREYFITEKQRRLEADPLFRKFFDFLFDFVVGEKDVYAFLVPLELSEQEFYTRLWVDRFIHKVREKISYGGELYTLWKFDYGTFMTAYRDLYVRVVSKEAVYSDTPILEMDLRAIRHCIVDQRVMTHFHGSIKDFLVCPLCGKEFKAISQAYLRKRLCPHCWEFIGDVNQAKEPE